MIRFKTHLIASLCVTLLAPFLSLPASAQYDDWKHSGSLFILTTPEGANLPESAAVEEFPLLVRLNKNSFDFSRTQKQGEDLRFATASGLPLPYQIEDWDGGTGEATVWVRIPKISGNSRQELRVFWGNANATSESNGAAVFNESNGYLSVWHLGNTIRDDVGTLESQDVDTSVVAGMIGKARHLAGRQGVFGGDQIPNFPSDANSHSTEAWFRAERPNTTIIGWGNEQAQGKVVMQFRSPPHVRMDCYFSGGNVDGTSEVRMGEWTHVVHTYQKGTAKLYVNGVLDTTNIGNGPPLAIKSPARLFLGGWYHNYDFVGDLDEVRVSREERSADWVKLQYENQKPNQTLVGSLVQPGSEFGVSSDQLIVAEGQQTEVTARAGGAQKVYWILKKDGRQSVVATDQLHYSFAADRVVGTQSATLQFRAIYPDDAKTQDIAITITDSVPEPDFRLRSPATWDGRQMIELVPQITNLKELQTQQVANLNYVWTIDGIAVIKQIEPGKLILKRSLNSGLMKVSVAIDNGGSKIIDSININVKEPSPDQEPWLHRTPVKDEQPEDNQFIARDDQNEGTLFYRGTLAENADSVFVRVFAGDELETTKISPLAADKSFSLPVKLKAGLIKYRTEFGSRTGDKEAILHTASNLVCGDVFLIIGQSNAVATDFGKEAPPEPSDWIRTFGATDGSPQGSRLKLWANAEARAPGGKSEIGYWGMELGRRLVESQELPICIINGAVGGTRIDQHQRNPVHPTDPATIYGRLLWRVQEARLTHGVRAILWHQGENDQGADGPAGGYGWETYRQLFIDLAGSWKEDYPNVQQYYAFQIWPKACSMGTNGSDNKLREVQRTLPAYFSNLTVMSTLGIKPPGGCHFPAAGYGEFARLIAPAIRHHIYHDRVERPFTPPNLLRAFFSNDRRDEIILEFDSDIEWHDAVRNQFYLDGDANLVTSGSADGTQLTLRLKTPSQAGEVTYLDSAAWNPDNLLYGRNGIAALTFCDVPISAD